MNVTKDKKGFGVVEILVIIVIIGLVGVIGWLVWSNQMNNSNGSQTNTTTETEKSTGLSISEWGVKLKTTHADDFTYTVTDKEGTLEFSGETYDSAVSIKVKSSLFTDSTTCGPDVGMSLLRIKGTPVSTADVYKVGERYYTSFGAPGICGNEKDTTLIAELRQDIRAANLEDL